MNWAVKENHDAFLYIKICDDFSNNPVKLVYNSKPNPPPKFYICTLLPPKDNNHSFHKFLEIYQNLIQLLYSLLWSSCLRIGSGVERATGLQNPLMNVQDKFWPVVSKQKCTHPITLLRAVEGQISDLKIKK